jgi:hypothetical protein
MIDTEETIEETRDRFDRGEKLFKLYTNPELVKQEQIKEFEKFGMKQEADAIREGGPIVGGRKVFFHSSTLPQYKKCWMCGLDYAENIARTMILYRQNAKKAVKLEPRIFAIQNALRLRRSLTLYGLSLG